jgi:hypothetical protein
MNVDVNNIKSDFTDYKDKQQYFKLLYKKQLRGNVVSKSRERTVSGKYVGVTYVTPKEVKKEELIVNG